MTAETWAELIIRLSVSLTMMAFGIDQILTPSGWLRYMPGWLERLLSSSDLFMRFHGAGNLFLGFLFAIGASPLLVGWLVLGWWVSILPFVLWAEWQNGLRDMVIIGAIGVFLALTVS